MFINLVLVITVHSALGQIPTMTFRLPNCSALTHQNAKYSAEWYPIYFSRPDYDPAYPRYLLSFALIDTAACWTLSSKEGTVEVQINTEKRFDTCGKDSKQCATRPEIQTNIWTYPPMKSAIKTTIFQEDENFIAIAFCDTYTYRERNEVTIGVIVGSRQDPTGLLTKNISTEEFSNNLKNFMIPVDNFVKQNSLQLNLYVHKIPASQCRNICHSYICKFPRQTSTQLGAFVGLSIILTVVTLLIGFLFYKKKCHAADIK